MRAARLAVPLLVAAAAAAGGCTDVGTNPNLAVAIEFDTLPFPAVVAGDTLRDSLGRAAPLHALAFNSSGALIANAPVQYIALDTGVTIDAGGHVVASARSGSVRIVGTVNGVQSISQSLQIARRPDTMVATGQLVDTLKYSLPDSASVNVTPMLNVRLLTSDTAGGITGTHGWLVSYQVTFRGRVLSPADTTWAYLENGNNARTALDTTKADGTSGRQLRVISTLLGTADSVFVTATARYRGAQVRGGPLTFVVHLLPKQKAR